MSGGIAVFCFDLDDTLLSECEYVESGLRAAGSLLDREEPRSESAAEWMVARWRDGRPRDVFQQVAARWRVDPAVWLTRLRSAYREHRPTVTPRPGVVALLRRIVARGDRLALISDGPLQAQRSKWEALALPFAFHPVVFTDERGAAYWKPHPWAFERVMAAHPDAAAFVYVADNPAKDFLAPNRLGWTTVLVRYGDGIHPCGAVPAGAAAHCAIGDLSALLDVAPLRAAPAGAREAPRD